MSSEYLGRYPPTRDRQAWRELFEERAAIMEYCGAMPRDRAERMARAWLAKCYRAVVRFERDNHK